MKRVAKVMTMAATLSITLSLGCSSTSPHGDSEDSGTTFPDADAGIPDAMPEAAGDVAVDCGAATCAPGCITGYTPRWRPPNPAHPRCTDAEIEQFVDGASDFSAFQTAHPTCFACLVTNDTASTLGALLLPEQAGFLTGNIAGCIAIRESDASATGCGAKTQARIDCEYAACADNCPVATQSDLDAFDACLGSAALGVCRTYASSSSSCILEPECFRDAYPSNQAWFRYLGGLFCGGVPSDAGAGEGG